MRDVGGRKTKLVALILTSLLMWSAPTIAKSAPISGWSNSLFQVSWFVMGGFREPEKTKPPPSKNTTKVDVYPYYAVLRVYCVDANDPNRDRGDSTLTVRSKISTDDAKANALSQAGSRDVCQDDGDSTRTMSQTR